MQTATILLLVLQILISAVHGGVSSSNGTTPMKGALRYGFHKVDECKEYTKAFLCIRKCLDLKYDVAYSDKHCKCTCFHKPEKAKFTHSWPGTRTNWRLGPPTTSKPIWAQPCTKNTPESNSDMLKKDDESDENTPSESNEPDETDETTELDYADDTTAPIDEEDADVANEEGEDDGTKTEDAEDNENRNKQSEVDNNDHEEDATTVDDSKTQSADEAEAK